MANDEPIDEKTLSMILNKQRYRDRQADALRWLRSHLGVGGKVAFDDLPQTEASAIYLAAKSFRWFAVIEPIPGGEQCDIVRFD